MFIGFGFLMQLVMKLKTLHIKYIIDVCVIELQNYLRPIEGAMTKELWLDLAPERAVRLFFVLIKTHSLLCS